MEERKESGNQKNLQQKRMDILGPFKVVLTEALILGLYNWAAAKKQQVILDFVQFIRKE